MVDTLDKHRIYSLLPAGDPIFFESIDVFKTINSTNQYCLDLSSATSTHVCLANQQTHGRGQQGKQWHSPPDVNIYLSLLWTFDCSSENLTGLSIAIGSVIAKYLSSLGTAPQLGLKWPNDILCDQKKLAGILIETRTINPQQTRAVIGVGLNVNQEDSLKAIDQPACSLKTIFNHEFDRNIIAAQLINRLYMACETFSKNHLKPFIPIWQYFDLLLNKPIGFSDGKKHYKGICLGIDKHGHLLLKTGNENILKFHSGSPSL